MGVVIVDSEYESSAKMFHDIFNEVLELGQSFSNELQYLSEHGFQDVLIDNAISDKASKIYTAMLNLEEASKDVSDSIKKFVEQADETDSYLY